MNELEIKKLAELIYEEFDSYFNPAAEIEVEESIVDRLIQVIKEND